MFDKPGQTKVLLPAKMFQQAKDREDFKRLLMEYMGTSYPDYTVKAVKEGFAYCERRD